MFDVGCSSFDMFDVNLPKQLSAYAPGGLVRLRWEGIKEDYEVEICRIRTTLHSLP